MYDSCADAVPRGWAYFSGAIWVPVPHPNMLKEWKRLQAGNMPILLDAFYCRDKRLSCLPLTSLPPPHRRSPHLSPRNEENSGRNECHQRNLYFCTSHLLNGRPPAFLPPPSREKIRAHRIFRSVSRHLTPTAFLLWRERGRETR